MPRYQINILLRSLKFTSIPKRYIVQLKSGIDNYTRKLRLAKFFYNTPEKIFSKMFLKLNLENLGFRLPKNGDRNLNPQLDILNDLDLKKMKTSFLKWNKKFKIH